MRLSKKLNEPKAIRQIKKTGRKSKEQAQNGKICRKHTSKLYYSIYWNCKSAINIEKESNLENKSLQKTSPKAKNSQVFKKLRNPTKKQAQIFGKTPYLETVCQIYLKICIKTRNSDVIIRNIMPLKTIQWGNMRIWMQFGLIAWVALITYVCKRL